MQTATLAAGATRAPTMARARRHHRFARSHALFPPFCGGAAQRSAATGGKEAPVDFGIVSLSLPPPCPLLSGGCLRGPGAHGGGPRTVQGTVRELFQGARHNKTHNKKEWVAVLCTRCFALLLRGTRSVRRKGGRAAAACEVLRTTVAPGSVMLPPGFVMKRGACVTSGTETKSLQSAHATAASLPLGPQAPVAMGISFSVYHHVKEMLDASDW